MPKLIGLVCISIVLGVSSVANATWLCIADKSTGFTVENGTWVTARFNVADDKFLLKEDPETKTFRWQEFGDKYKGFPCKAFGDKDEPTLFECSSLIHALINVKTLRFMTWYPVGYVDGRDNNANTPYIAIGRCSKF